MSKRSAVAQGKEGDDAYIDDCFDDEEDVVNVSQNGNGTKKTTTKMHSAAAADIRQSVEYQVAWDVELWRATQLQQVDTEVALKRKRLMDEARRKAAERERTVSIDIEQRLRELTLKEKKFAEEEKQQERRKMRLLDTEKLLKDKRIELEQVRKRVDLDADTRVKRVREECDHKLSLLEDKVEAAQQEARRSEERLTSAQRDYMKLYEEFADFRTKALTDNPYSQQMEAVRAHHSSEIIALTERHDRRYQDTVGQFQQRLQAASDESKKLSSILAQKKEQMRALATELHNTRSRLDDKTKDFDRLVLDNKQLRSKIAEMEREMKEKAVVDQQARNALDSEEIQHLKSLMRESRDAVVSAAADTTKDVSRPDKRGTQATTTSTTNGDGGGIARPSTMLESTLHRRIERWKVERARLLSSGIYTHSSPLITDLERKIREALGALADT